MRLADKLSRFQDTGNEFKSIPRFDAIPIVNKLLLKLKNYPLNLPSNKDIPHQLRVAFGLLLNDDWFDNNHPYIDRFVNRAPYNILNNSTRWSRFYVLSILLKSLKKKKKKR